ncbi:hypothetical protein GQ600_23491 [Phytophthora cactorum]|nr:hypothetical protein GQ600_23491 [Phytophthora cactorum]
MSVNGLMELVQSQPKWIRECFHKPRLRKTFGVADIHRISKAFVKLHQCCDRENDLSKTFRAANGIYTSFKQGGLWWF